MTIILDRLKSYDPRSKQEEFGALKEIYQEIALAGLARSDFFKKGAFQGDTALRIVHKLNRFSEDLDFVLQSKEEYFTWQPYLAAIETEFKAFGVNIEVKERAQALGPVKTAFLKEDSFGKVFELKYDRLPSDIQKITIKFEIDTHPPEGSNYENSFLSYPYPFSILIQDLPTLFATKCHAILCRKYEKGRDWFDFVWYLNKEIPINAVLLQNALKQAGPFKGQEIAFNLNWLIKELEQKVIQLDWSKVKLDVKNFLKLEDQRQVEFWSQEMFTALVKRIQFFKAR